MLAATFRTPRPFRYREYFHVVCRVSRYPSIGGGAWGGGMEVEFFGIWLL
jgi:hypothetical protein